MVLVQLSFSMCFSDLLLAARTDIIRMTFAFIVAAAGIVCLNVIAAFTIVVFSTTSFAGRLVTAVCY